MIEKLLFEIGLTKGEIKVYLTLLKLGETTTGQIIKSAEISSGKIYEILDKLIQKGLASYLIKDKTKSFSAASPNRILDYLHEKEKDLKEKEAELIKQLPLLQRMESKPEYETRLFKGFKGINTAINEALDDLAKKDEVLVMGIHTSREKQYQIMWEKWHRKRISKKINCKAIFSEKYHEYYRILKKLKPIQIKILKGITPSVVDVMGDRVLIFTYEKQPSCLSIRNLEIAKSFTTFFGNLWKAAN